MRILTLSDFIVEEITGYIALFLMALFFMMLIVLEVLLKKTFNKLYMGEKKMFFFQKISWLKNNFENFEFDDQSQVKKITIVKKLMVVILVAIFFLYFIGNLVK